MTVIEVQVDDGPVVVTKRFTGRRLLHWRQEDGMRKHSFRVFRTAKGQFAVYERDDPNWDATSSWRGGWPDGWWNPGKRQLSVFATTAEMAGILPDKLIAAITRAEETPAVEELDI